MFLKGNCYSRGASLAGSGMGSAGVWGERGWGHADCCEDTFAGRLANIFCSGAWGRLRIASGRWPRALGAFQDEGAAVSEMGGNGVVAHAKERRDGGEGFEPQMEQMDADCGVVGEGGWR